MTPQVARVLEAASSACSFADWQTAAGLKDRVHFLKTHLESLRFAGWIEQTIPDKPRSSKQKYRLTDALGYTDPERLRLMGAVLAKAAKECQIVIFTCVPDRYGNVGEATVVAIG